MNERVDKGNEVIKGIMMECVSFTLDSSSILAGPRKRSLWVWDFYYKKQGQYLR